MPPAHTTLADFFNALVNNIEQLILTGEEPYPAERTLITSGMTLFGVESLYRGEVKLLTGRGKREEGRQPRTQLGS